MRENIKLGLGGSELAHYYNAHNFILKRVNLGCVKGVEVEQITCTKNKCLHK